MGVRVTRTCQECGTILVQRQNEKPGRFATRKYCSTRCVAAVGSRASAARPPTSGVIERNGYLMKWVRGRKQARGSSQSSGIYVYVHRLVMEAYVGRELASHEVVHHINHDRHDNRIENLRLYNSNAEHRLDETIELRGPKPLCPVCGATARRDRTYCSRRCAVEGRRVAA